MPSRTETVCGITHSCNYLQLISPKLNVDINSNELTPIYKGEAICKQVWVWSKKLSKKQNASLVEASCHGNY